jgi:hypothetical protein
MRYAALAPHIKVILLILAAQKADAFEPDFQQAFWGENYPRLLSIKRETDPTDLLWCRACVGNERWEEIGNKLCQK